MNPENFGAREEIRNPEGLNLLELPKAVESPEEIEINGGKALIIKPEGFADAEIIVGARTGDPGEAVWDKATFYEKADIDPKRIVGIKQAHTANVKEIGAESAGIGATFKKGDEDERITTDDGKGIDAAWTKDKDLGFVVATADCVAVMVAGKDKAGEEIVGIAHAGIAGAQQDIVGNLLRDMKENGDANQETLKVYVGPNINERNYTVMSETMTDEQVDKVRGGEIIVSNEDGETKIGLTKITESFLKFKERYGEEFQKLYGRELAANDVYYIDKNDNGDLELHYNLNAMVFLSLIGNGVAVENIAFSELCSFGDNLPSNRRTKETTGIFSVVKTK
ncbi:MAG: laccase domain-containing protein [Candidatus Berkelbacteria bacterium]|nr:laccase domain-containing protein [Candidatus Berkelbacteria bacterium]